MIRHIIPKGDLSAEHKRLVRQQIDDLSSDKPWLVQVTQYRRKRTLEQNSFLHAVPLKIICDFTGYELHDMKQWLMGQAFGWEQYEVMGEPRKRPRLTTSQLNTEQFNWFLEWLEAWASQELGLIVPKPNETIEG
jgi:hypothetical protein